MRRLCLVLLVTACASVAHRGRPVPDQGWLVASPTGNLEVRVVLQDLGGTAGYPAGKRLYYAAALDDHQVLLPSPLGITRADQQFVEGLVFLGETAGVVHEVYDLPHGKRSHH